MMRSSGIKFQVLAVILALLPAIASAVEVPKTWKRTMTNDPSTNYFLAKITAPLGSKDAELLRTVLVSILATRGCKGVRVDDTVGESFLALSGYYHITGKRWSDAEFLANDSLRGTSDREIAHLCAGLDYLFGKTGRLAPNLLKFGPTEPNHYDAMNPYIVLPILPRS